MKYYAIGHYWNEKDIGFYTINGFEIFKDAGKYTLTHLEDVQKRFPDKDWKLFDLEIKERKGK